MAPGTWGTLAGIPLYLALSLLPLWAYALALIPVIWGAIYAAGRAEIIYDSHDDRRIVIDEVAGYAVTMLGTAPSVFSVILGFFVFRAFDIFKPWPCRDIDRRMPGGAGVVLDDVAAGVYGVILMLVIGYVSRCLT